MPFSNFLSVIRPILNLYDDCKYEDASILAKREMGRCLDETLRVILEALRMHLEGYSRWESSYDYAAARSMLRQADILIEQNMSICPELELRALNSMRALNGVLVAAIDLENALISNDSKSMTEIATRLQAHAYEGLGHIEGLGGDEESFVGWIAGHLKSWGQYGAGVAAYARAMSAFRTEEFLSICKESEKTILEAMAFLENEDDEDAYTELASYYEFMKYHIRLAKDHPEYLILKGNELRWLYSFWIDRESLNRICDALLEDSSEFTSALAAKGITVETIDEDTVSDLFETVLGADGMKNLVISLRPVKLVFRGNEIELGLTVRLYRYGIGTVCLTTDEEELTVSDLRVYLSFSGPHSAEYQIEWESRSYCYLHTLAENLVTTLGETFHNMEPEGTIRFMSHLNWNAYVLVRRGLWSRGGKEERQLSLSEAQLFPDYVGLYVGQMEARAALDDWVLREPAVPRNLAPIRSHVTDLLVTTENHGVMAFPDDPRWIVIQYQESLETGVRLRCLISTLIQVAGDILTSFIDDTSDLAKELDTLDLDIAERRITETRRSLLPVIHFETLAHMNIELIRGTLTSNYRDHAELLRAIMDDLNVDRLVNYLERRLGILSHHETLFSDIAASVVERRTKEKERWDAMLDSRRTHAMEFVEIFISVLAIGEVVGFVFNAIRAFGIEIDPVVESLSYFAGMGVMLTIIFLIRRLGRAEGGRDQPSSLGLDT
ncbi:MAG: hypothetical protein HXY34_02635 [Candidatus Thorarchaeota archaeon]|nr:hypothetical protein [Candidatus Thorarchaeota archaeon]